MAGAQSISVKMAKAIAAQIDGLDRLLVDMEDYLPLVRDEIADMFVARDAAPSFWRQRALLFALASPQNRFDSNVVAARRLHAGLREFADVEAVYQALAADKHGTVSSGGVARAIFHSLPVLRENEYYNGAILRDLQKERAIMGAGLKVTAFAAHLNDPTDKVFTLDTHMYRGLVKTILGIDGTWTAGTTAYTILEEAVIGWAQRTYPDDTLFTVQWAMWSVFRGQFDSHIAIFN